MKQMVSSVELIIECRDYRVPLSSRNPLFEETLQGRERIIVYTKRDLAAEVLDLTVGWFYFLPGQTVPGEKNAMLVGGLSIATIKLLYNRAAIHKADFGIAIKPADTRNNPKMAYTPHSAVFRLQG